MSTLELVLIPFLYIYIYLFIVLVFFFSINVEVTLAKFRGHFAASLCIVISVAIYKSHFTQRSLLN